MKSYMLSIIEYEGEKCVKLDKCSGFVIWDKQSDAHDIMLKAVIELERYSVPRLGFYKLEPT